mmetsp:Transcript_45570/g.99247  ORF Transcript_45570/g.99247 Transcript_45570/m.99247 type:complete len:205 (+) Transcript_45570:241-855(+)
MQPRIGRVRSIIQPSSPVRNTLENQTVCSSSKACVLWACTHPVHQANCSLWAFRRRISRCESVPRASASDSSEAAPRNASHRPSRSPPPKAAPHPLRWSSCRPPAHLVGVDAGPAPHAARCRRSPARGPRHDTSCPHTRSRAQRESIEPGGERTRSPGPHSRARSEKCGARCIGTNLEARLSRVGSLRRQEPPRGPRLCKPRQG